MSSVKKSLKVLLSNKKKTNGHNLSSQVPHILKIKEEEVPIYILSYVHNAVDTSTYIVNLFLKAILTTEHYYNFIESDTDA